jgi:hypothetical protein
MKRLFRCELIPITIFFAIAYSVSPQAIVVPQNALIFFNKAELFTKIRNSILKKENNHVEGKKFLFFETIKTDYPTFPFE